MKLPRIYCVNWFRKGADGKFVWPGYGENMRVLKWMVERIDGRADGAEHVFGISPRYEDLSWDRRRECCSGKCSSMVIHHENRCAFQTRASAFFE